MTEPEKATAGLLINPFYAITFNEDLFKKHKLEGVKEDWALKNAQLIEEMGANDWLGELLTALSEGSNPEYVRDVIISPYKCIVFSERLQGEHEPLVTRQQWQQASVKLMKELGKEAWLWQLLHVLESGSL